MARWWPPLLALLLQRLLLSLVAVLSGLNPFAPATWMRWDSGYYVNIANEGYTALGHCTPETHYPADTWCSSAGWFPGYPLLIHILGGSAGAALLLGAACQLACLVLIWHLLRQPGGQNERRWHHWPALLLAAFFPGNVYMAAVFPAPVVSLAVLGCIALCLSGRFTAAALAALIAAACYPTGVLLAPVVAVWALLHRRHRALPVLLGSLIGYAAVLAFLQQQTGRWDAYFLVQRKYGYHFGLPFDALFARLKPLVNRRYRSPATFTTALQTLLSTTLVISALTSTAFTVFAPEPAAQAGATSAGQSTPAARKRDERTSLVLLCVGAFWLAPLVLGGNLSLYRAEALLLPVVLLVPSLPRPLQLTLLGTALALSAPMAALFFRASLV